jgi:hypothetical protein
MFEADFVQGVVAPPTSCVVATAVIELALNPDRSLLVLDEAP